MRFLPLVRASSAESAGAGAVPHVTQACSTLTSTLHQLQRDGYPTGIAAERANAGQPLVKLDTRSHADRLEDVTAI